MYGNNSLIIQTQCDLADQIYHEQQMEKPRKKRKTVTNVTKFINVVNKGEL
jgi:hypothetical protein